MDGTARLSSLRDDIVDELRWNSAIDADRIEVGTEEDVVVLRGSVHTYPERCLAEKIVKKMRVPAAVRNEIEVRLTVGDYRSDTTLQRVLGGVVESLALRAEELPSVSVAGGWVTIDGVLPWAWQKRLVEAAVCGIAGVRGIANRIRVRPRQDADGDVIPDFERACRRRSIATDRIAVSFRDGRMVLEGKVLSCLEHDEVLETAWSAPGVCEVDDHLTVSGT